VRGWKEENVVLFLQSWSVVQLLIGWG